MFHTPSRCLRIRYASIIHSPHHVTAAADLRGWFTVAITRPLGWHWDSSQPASRHGLLCVCMCVCLCLHDSVELERRRRTRNAPQYVNIASSRHVASHRIMRHHRAHRLCIREHTTEHRNIYTQHAHVSRPLQQPKNCGATARKHSFRGWWCLRCVRHRIIIAFFSAVLSALSVALRWWIGLDVERTVWRGFFLRILRTFSNSKRIPCARLWFMQIFHIANIPIWWKNARLVYVTFDRQYSQILQVRRGKNVRFVVSIMYVRSSQTGNRNRQDVDARGNAIG